MRYLYPVIILLLTCFLYCISPASAQKRLTIIGSSTTACAGPTDPANCYVNRLRSYYNTELPNDTLVDGLAFYGWSCYRGMPSSYIPPYTDPLLQPDTDRNITAALNLSPKPDVIIVNYPTNGYDSLPIENIMYCLRTIRDSANVQGVPCFITTTQPRTSPPFNTSDAKLKLAILKDSILAEFGYFAIDFWTDLYNPADSSIRYDAGDNTHMNDIGHDSLYQRVLAKNIFNATLPATFLKFNAVYQDKSTLVTWSTAKEIDVAAYEIQRSGDGAGFTKLAVVSAINSTGNNQYAYTDKQPLKGWNYYKVVIVDKDGKKQLSPVFKVFANAGKLALIKLFTQPSQVLLELQSDALQNAELQLLSSTGALLKKESMHIEAGMVRVPVNTSNLASGVYYIKLSTALQNPIVVSFVKK
jgi:hypothetical protein